MGEVSLYYKPHEYKAVWRTARILMACSPGRIPKIYPDVSHFLSHLF